ncbi:hypothetical protein ACSBR2_042422 [Camellia fascicularis]
MPSTSDLKFAGIKFVPNQPPAGEELKIRFSECKGLSKFIYRPPFVIPTLFLYEFTEPFLRNLIAYEQCRSGVRCYFISYANFMDTLISSDEDVHVLHKVGIICNHLGASEDATKLFNNLCKEVVLKESYFVETISAADRYSKFFWSDFVAHLRSTSSSSSSSFSSSPISNSLLDKMKEGRTSLRRLFDMEHTSLATHMNDYSGSPIIKSIPLWGSDTDDGVHDDPWKSMNKTVGLVFGSRSGAQCVLGAENRSMDGIGLPVGRNPRISKHRLNRTKSFRRLSRFSFWRCSGFRFGLKLRRLRIVICGRKF